MKRIILLLINVLFLTQITFAQKDVLKILAIGNSFSEDAIENYLHELAKAANKKIIIGNMYIGGASLELHVKNSLEDKSNYNYRKVNLEGEKVITKDISLSHAINDEDWDYISLQQASPVSGKFDVVMKDLPALIKYVNAKKESKTKLIYHQTWAYQHDSDHKGFQNYDGDQLTMYNEIVDVSKKIIKSKDFAIVVPAGTAIQNARTSSVGDRYTRDGYHLELSYGRFTAACVWYEKLFGMDVRKNPYKPENISDLQAKIAKESAHKATKKPLKISKIKY